MLTHNSQSNILGLNYELKELEVGYIIDKLKSSNVFYDKYNLNYFDFNSLEHRNFVRFASDNIRKNDNTDIYKYREELSRLFDKYATSKEYNIAEDMEYSFTNDSSLNILAGFETGFIDIEILPDGNWRLLDGFNRLFRSSNLTDEVLKYKVYVRFYDELNDISWVNYMLVNNSWKFSYSNNLLDIFSRGFCASLYLRSGINLLTFTESELKYLNFYPLGNSYRLSNALEEKDVKLCMFNNSEFINDLKTIFELVEWFNNREFFEYNKKNEVKTSFKAKISYGNYSLPVKRFIELMVSSLGYIRKYEFINKLENKAISVEDLTSYFETVDNKKFIKYLNLIIDGHVLNNIDGIYLKEYRINIYNRLGYGNIITE